MAQQHLLAAPEVRVVGGQVDPLSHRVGSPGPRSRACPSAKPTTMAIGVSSSTSPRVTAMTATPMTAAWTAAAFRSPCVRLLGQQDEGVGQQCRGPGAAPASPLPAGWRDSCCGRRTRGRGPCTLAVPGPLPYQGAFASSIVLLGDDALAQVVAARPVGERPERSIRSSGMLLTSQTSPRPGPRRRPARSDGRRRSRSRRTRPPGGRCGSSRGTSPATIGMATATPHLEPLVAEEDRQRAEDGDEERAGVGVAEESGEPSGVVAAPDVRRQPARRPRSRPVANPSAAERSETRPVPAAQMTPSRMADVPDPADPVDVVQPSRRRAAA